MALSHSDAILILEANAEQLQALPGVQGLGLREDGDEWSLVVYIASEAERPALPDRVGGTLPDGSQISMRVVTEPIGNVGLE